MPNPTDTDRDDLDWNRDRDGRMADYATTDVPDTVPYTPEEE